MCIYGYIPTPLTVNKMVCFYFYHPGGAPRFSWFSCVFIWWYFWCILMCSCVLFLVRFSRVFCRAFSGVFWWFCWWYFLCFSWCFFHCVLVLFFVLVPFLFYIRFPLVVVLFFAVLFFVVFGCFFRAFFRAFCGVFFVSFIVLFFVHFFVLFLVFFFEFVFFRALGGTRDKQPQYFAFWPVLFSVLFLVVTTSEDRIYTIHTYIYIYALLFPKASPKNAHQRWYHWVRVGIWWRDCTCKVCGLRTNRWKLFASLCHQIQKMTNADC